MESEQIRFLRWKLNEHFSFRGHFAIAYLDPEEGVYKNLPSALDSFAELNGCKRLGDNWVSLEEIEATRTIDYLLTTSLCYGADIMTQEMALEFRNQFLGLFEGSRKYFTNCDMPLDSRPPNGWVPLTRATFDAGVIVTSERCIAMLWVEDED